MYILVAVEQCYFVELYLKFYFITEDETRQDVYILTDEGLLIRTSSLAASSGWQIRLVALAVAA